MSLGLIMFHAMKTYLGTGGIAPRFFNLALDGGEWPASRPGSLSPGEIAPGTHWLGDLVDPRAGLEEKIVQIPAENRIPIV
jgi:hypothetical protein